MDWTSHCKGIGLTWQRGSKNAGHVPDDGRVNVTRDLFLVFAGPGGFESFGQIFRQWGLEHLLLPRCRVPERQPC